MQSIKTAISIEKTLFDQAVDIAQSMKVSRSKLFVIALKDFIERQKNRALLNQINAAYSDEPEQSEQTLLRKSHRLHRIIVEGEW